MKNITLRLILLLALSASVVTAEPAIIRKARAFLGTETAIESIKSLHYYGTLTIEGAEQNGPISVEIIFQKPYRQKSSITSAKGSEVTVLNGYDGWQRVSANNDESRWSLSLLKTEQIKGLRANVWENLSFFRGLEGEGGQIEDLGETTVGGVSCQKLAFIHPHGTTFHRYFDRDTGRLVLTETMRGEKISEEGSMVVAGVRFPKVLVTVTPRGDGSTRTISINFDRVVVNEVLDPAEFEMPLLISR